MLPATGKLTRSVSGATFPSASFRVLSYYQCSTSCFFVKNSFGEIGDVATALWAVRTSKRRRLSTFGRPTGPWLHSAVAALPPRTTTGEFLVFWRRSSGVPLSERRQRNERNSFLCLHSFAFLPPMVAAAPPRV